MCAAPISCARHLEELVKSDGVDNIEGPAEWLAGANLVELTRTDSPIPFAHITDQGRELAADRHRRRGCGSTDYRVDNGRAEYDQATPNQCPGAFGRMDP